jgi:hypothetical protein
MTCLFIIKPLVFFILACFAAVFPLLIETHCSTGRCSKEFTTSSAVQAFNRSTALVSLSHSLQQQQQVEDDSCGDLLDTSTESGHLLDISADSLMVTGSSSRAAAAAGGIDTSFDRDSIAGSEPDNQESSHTSSSGQFGAIYRDFLGPEMATSKASAIWTRVPFGAQKLEISGA